MNKFSLLLLLFLFTVASAKAQTVTVNKQNEKVKSESIEVFATTLDGKKEDIQNAWVRYLKDMGKLKQGIIPVSGSVMTVAEPIINTTPYTKGLVYASSREGEKSSTVWMGINPADWNEGDVPTVTRELEKMLYQFGIKFYRDRVQVEIDQTQQALEAVEKQQQRAVSQQKDLANKLVNNEQQKIQLEKSLEANKLENAVLKVKIDNNKKAQDSLQNAGLQIKKVMESNKEKQRKIN